MNIKSEIIRYDDQYLIKCSAKLECPLKFSSCSLELRSEDRRISVLSTSSGTINNDVISTKKVSVDFVTEYKPNAICYAAFLDEHDNLIYDEHQCLDLPALLPIRPADSEIEMIKTINTDMLQRLKQFEFSLRKQKSTPWRLRLTFVDQNIVCKVNAAGKLKTFMAFGDLSHELSHYDFVFPIYSDVRQFVIPKELIASRVKHYNNLQVVCSQLVQADFFAVDDVFFKMPISNIVDLSSFRSHSGNI